MYQCKSILYVLIFVRAQLVLSLSPLLGCLLYMCLIIVNVARQTKEGVLLSEAIQMLACS
jgi:hypothetical protein